MIQGNGLLANAFKRDFGRDPSVLIFACGVSDSSETDQAAFHREQQLLESSLAGALPLVYFSSCALVNHPTHDNAYLLHKRRMEAKVLDASPKNLVLRLPQVVGPTPNPNTLTNFIANCIRNGSPFSVWAKAERNLIDVEDVAAIGRILIHMIDLQERTIPIASARSLPMPEIVSLFEQAMDRKAVYTIEDKGDPLQIDSSLSVSIAATVGIDLGNSYAARVIDKYYGH